MATMTQTAQPSQTTNAKSSLLDSIVEEQHRAAARYQPVMQPEQVAERYKQLKWYIENVMLEGVDYGTVPGIDKPFLFKPGAQGLCTFFGYVPSYETLDQIEDWEGLQHGEPLFYYKFKCTIMKDNARVGEGIGSASSWESKYRYRWVPAEFLPAGIDKSTLPVRSASVTEFAFAIDKAETGGPYGKPASYWQEWAVAIESGEAKKTKRKTKTGKEMDAWERGGVAYRVPNDGFPDVINTTQKQGCKRAYIEATLSATGASRFFTQDEDAVQSMQEYTRPAAQPGARQQPPVQHAEEQPQQAGPATLEQVLSTFAKLQTIRDRFAQLKIHWLTILDENTWDQILLENKCDGVKEFGSIGNAKKCFTKLWETFEREKSMQGDKTDDQQRA
jgi:hypothetical protein